jgi:diguanylate cyclase (GGDEF)-like protein/PAS domain S-box-containing protein
MTPLQALALTLAVTVIVLVVGAALIAFRGRRAMEEKNAELERQTAELSREVAERTQAEAALAHERDLLQALMDNIPDTIYFKDAASRFTRINRAQCKVLGVASPEEAIGKSDLDFQARDLAQGFYAEEQALVESGQPIIDRLEFNPTPDGQPRWFSATKVPIKDKDGRVTGIVGISRDATERQQAEIELRATEAKYRTLVEQLPAITYVVALGEVNRTIYISPQVETLLGFSPDEWLADRELWIKQIHSDDREPVLAEVRRNDERGQAVSLEYRALARDGRVLWFRNQSEIVRDESGRARFSQGIMLDITQRKQAEEALQEAHHKLASWVKELEQRTTDATVLSRMGEMLQTALSPQEAYTVISQFGPQLFPAQAGAVYLISASRNFVEAVAAWGEPPVDPEQRIFAPDECWALRRGRAHVVSALQADLRCRHLGRSAWSSYLCMPMMAQGEAMGVLHLAAADERARLTESRQQLAQTVAEQLSLALANLRLRETLRNQSIRDPLTGLFNRRYLEETLERELHRAARGPYPLGIIMLDLDHFKHFNDTFGHEAGDLVLRELGQLLKSHIRGSDIACRYGGEEFILILPEAPLETIRKRAETLRTAVKQLAVKQRGQPLGALSMSLGVALFPEHGANSEMILRAADQALYRAKHEGRDRVVVAG